MSRVCPTCPYKWVIAQRISMRTHLKRKEVDDVLGGKDSWANVDVVDGESMPALAVHVPSTARSSRVERKGVREGRTDERTKTKTRDERGEKLTAATCPACDKVVKANFMQLQIRSADEPMTTF